MKSFRNIYFKLRELYGNKCIQKAPKMTRRSEIAHGLPSDVEPDAEPISDIDLEDPSPEDEMGCRLRKPVENEPTNEEETPETSRGSSPDDERLASETNTDSLEVEIQNTDSLEVEIQKKLKKLDNPENEQSSGSDSPGSGDDSPSLPPIPPIEEIKLKPGDFHDYPDDLKMDEADIFLLTSKKEEEVGRKIKYLFEQLKYKGMEPESEEKYCKLYLLEDMPDESEIENLQKAQNKCSFIFILITKDFCNDAWARYQKEELLVKCITNDKQWKIVPLYTQPRAQSNVRPDPEKAYEIPTGLLSFRGVDISKILVDDYPPDDLKAVAELDKHFKAGLVRMLAMDAPKRANREEELAEKKEKWRKKKKEEKQLKMIEQRHNEARDARDAAANLRNYQLYQQNLTRSMPSQNMPRYATPQQQPTNMYFQPNTYHSTDPPHPSAFGYTDPQPYMDPQSHPSSSRFPHSQPYMVPQPNPPPSSYNDSQSYMGSQPHPCTSGYTNSQYHMGASLNGNQHFHPPGLMYPPNQQWGTQHFNQPLLHPQPMPYPQQPTINYYIHSTSAQFGDHNRMEQDPHYGKDGLDEDVLAEEFGNWDEKGNRVPENPMGDWPDYPSRGAAPESKGHPRTHTQPIPDLKKERVSSNAGQKRPVTIHASKLTEHVVSDTTSAEQGSWPESASLNEEPNKVKNKNFDVITYLQSPSTEPTCNNNDSGKENISRSEATKKQYFSDNIQPIPDFKRGSGASNTGGEKRPVSIHTSKLTGYVVPDTTGAEQASWPESASLKEGPNNFKRNNFDVVTYLQSQRVPSSEKSHCNNNDSVKKIISESKTTDYFTINTRGILDPKKEIALLVESSLATNKTGTIPDTKRTNEVLPSPCPSNFQPTVKIASELGIRLRLTESESRETEMGVRNRDDPRVGPTESDDRAWAEQTVLKTPDKL